MKKNKMIHVAWLILILGMAFSIYNGVAALNTTTNEDMFELSSADEYVIANRTTKHFLYDSLNGVYPLFSGIENPSDYLVQVNGEDVELKTYKPFLKIPGNDFRDQYYYVLVEKGSKLSVSTSPSHMITISTYLSEEFMNHIFISVLGIFLTIILTISWLVFFAVKGKKSSVS